MIPVEGALAPNCVRILGCGVTCTRSTHGPGEVPQAPLEDTVGETINDTIAETVTNSQPGGQEGCKVVSAASGALQQEVDDVRQPQDVEHASDAEEDHSIALVRTGLGLPSLTALAAEPGLPLADFLCVLLADAEDVEIGEAHNEGCWSVQHHHDEQGEVGVGVPGLCTPLKHISMISRFAPVEKRRQEDQAGVQPNKENTQT